VTQEIFVKAYFALDRFKGDSSFFTWLYRIAANACLDHLRRNKHAAISLDQPLSDEDEGSRLDTLRAPPQDRPEAGLEGDPHQLLQLLNPDQRLILNLRETEGYSYEEIAEILNCAVNTVKSRINRAREAHKKAYFEAYGEGNIPNAKIVEKSEEIT
jgi:RNA polymerase sigma-70 factor (ECF subfamily)